MTSSGRGSGGGSPARRAGADTATATTTAVAVLLCLTGACERPPSTPSGPMGVLPSATTTAEPEWIPRSFRAGVRVAADPRERRFTELRRLSARGNVAAAAWYPEGDAIVVEERDDLGCGMLSRVTLGAGARERLTPAASGCAHQPWVHSDGRVLFVWHPRRACFATVDGLAASSRSGSTARPGEDDDVPCAVATLRGGRVVPLPGGASGRDPVEGPNGDILFSAPGEPGAGSEIFSLTPSGRRDAWLASPGSEGAVAVAPNRARTAWDAPAAVRASAPLVMPPPPATTAGPSPSSRAAARTPSLPRTGAARPAPTEASRGEDEVRTIWIAGRRAIPRRALPPLGSVAREPAFLSDSRHLVFVSDHGVEAGNSELFLVDLDAPVSVTGLPSLMQLTFSPGADRAPRISPDGRALLFISARGRPPTMAEAPRRPFLDVYLATLDLP
ncbi:MAG: hypothetical protein AAF715_05555 [Myxococcota bacterium]